MHNTDIQSALWVEISNQIQQRIKSVKPLTGGAFTENCVLQCETGRYFVKLSDNPDCLTAEADGLTAISNTKTLRVPDLIATGQWESTGYLITEYLELGQVKSDYCELGVQLAQMHRTAGTHYGWHRDNYIGGSRQINTFQQRWMEFFRDSRLGYQFRLAYDNHYRGELTALGDQVLKRVEVVLESHNPKPSLLHGDLWWGNCGYIAPEIAVVFDPAVYHGDRETDLAMTRLFGEFPHRFYDCYAQSWMLEPGWRQREPAYSLYHILNHLNLFGTAYLERAQALARRFLQMTA